MNNQAPKQFTEKFWLLWGSQAVSLAGSFAVQFAIIWWLAWMYYVDAASIAHVFVALGVRAIGGAFHAPAMLASTSLMVPEEHYVRVQGLNQALQSGSLLLATIAVFVPAITGMENSPEDADPA